VLGGSDVVHESADLGLARRRGAELDTEGRHASIVGLEMSYDCTVHPHLTAARRMVEDETDLVTDREHRVILE
jgi:hypothetical protein